MLNARHTEAVKFRRNSEGAMEPHTVSWVTVLGPDIIPQPIVGQALGIAGTNRDIRKAVRKAQGHLAATNT